MDTDLFALHNSEAGLNGADAKSLKILNRLRKWNDTQVKFDEITIHRKFERYVNIQPDHPALHFNDRTESYSELNKKANIVANYLIDKGIKTEELVGVVMKRTPELVYAMLGILKAGAAYVPIDPDYPSERIEYLLQDSQCKYVLTDGSLHHHQGIVFSGTVGDIHRIVQQAEKTTPVKVPVKHDSLAYTIYTSGSTGRPKGAMVEHRGIINFINCYQKVFEITPADRIIQFASISFAASVSEIFMALLTGASLYLIPKATILHHKQFEDFLLDKNISIATLPPHYIVDLDPAKNKLRLLITAGSPASWTTVEKWRKHVTYYNAYGTSETSVGISIFNTTGVEINSSSVPIGKPNFNTRFYILNELGELVEPGEPGELCVSGVCVGRGYFNRPELTAEKFPLNPYEPGQRMYRTGDLARWVSGGNIELLGRIDDQVKINGHRIEPDEIAAVLVQATAIDDVIVIAKKVNGDVRLCAYCVAPSLENIDSIRQYAQQKLPEYMIPSFFIKIDAIPLNINGKLDKKALPDPLISSLNKADWQPPRNPNEKLLNDIWCSVLKLESHQLGVYDNFFHIGGDSIKAIKIISTLFGMDYLLEVSDLFHNPTIAALGQIISKADMASPPPPAVVISPDCLTGIEQRQIVENIIARDPVQENIHIENVYPLSPMQRGLYFYYLTGSSVPYMVQSEFILSGDINVNQFKACLAQLVARHEVLRTVFYLHSADEPLQVVLSTLPLAYHYEDISRLDPKRQQQFMHAWYKQDRKKLFKLDKESAIRFCLFKIAADEYSIAISFHHIIMDGWCQGIIWSELQKIYHLMQVEDAISTGANNLPAAAPYHHYIQWLSRQDMQRGLAYWYDTLKGYESLATIPYTRRGDHESPHYQSLDYKINDGLSSKITQLCKSHQITLNSLFKTVWGILLQKYNNCKDVVFGEVIAGRPAHLVDADQMLGLFINTVPVRIAAQKDQGLLALIRSVQEQTLMSQKYQYISLAEIQSQSELKQHLLDHLLVFENVPLLNGNDSDNQPEFTVKAGRIIEETNYNLNVTIVPHAEITINFLFNSHLYDEQKIKVLFEQMNLLLQQAIEHPLQSVSSLSILPPGKGIEPVLNGLRVEYPVLGIHALIEQQAILTPTNLAVSAVSMGSASSLAGTCVDYQTLNRQANKLARYLLALGVDSNQCVGILLERSPEFIISLLAVLKTGAAYVPMDSNYPSARLQRILNVAKPTCVITRESSQETLSGLEYNSLNLDGCWANIQAHDDVNINLPFLPERPAQILFTSGTTGEPKGVLVSHAGLVNHALFIKHQLQLSESDNVLQFAALGFDTHSEEIFPALLTGARVVLRPADLLQSFDRLIQIIKDYQITILDLPTAYWNHWVDELVEVPANVLSAIASVRWVIVGGESISVGHVKQWQQLNPHIPVINSYGPTETTVICSWYVVPQLSADAIQIPIGTPLHNTEFYILDMDLHPVLDEHVGELYIGGAGVALGYFNAPELTAAKFITPSWQKDSGQRLYKTGDLVRFHVSENNLHYIGRTDNQIKLRGFRIELDEIKSALLNHPLIHQAVVTTDTVNAQLQIIAFVQVLDDIAITDLKYELELMLPQQLLPSDIICVDRWPLNTNGKIDLQQLRTLRQQLPPAQNLATTRLEQQLCDIWGAVLNRTITDIQASFFELGGHSLKAISLLSKIKKQMGIDFPAAALFRYPTIALMAKNIESGAFSLVSSPLVPLSISEKANSLPPLFLIHPIGGSVFCYQSLANNLAEYYNVFGLETEELNKANPVFRSIPEIADHYIKAMLAVGTQGPWSVAGWSMGGQIAQEIAGQLQQRGYDVALLALIDTWHPAINPVKNTLPNEILMSFLQDLVSVRGEEYNLDAMVPGRDENDSTDIYLQLIANKLIPGDIGPDQFQTLFSVYKNHLHAMIQHEPAAYDGATLLIQASELQDKKDSFIHGLGWQTAIPQLKTIAMPGDHYSLLTSDTSRAIAQAIHSCILIRQDENLPETV